jgi:hypothetical protein
MGFTFPFFVKTMVLFGDEVNEAGEERNPHSLLQGLRLS